jgi:hypothetical protein
MRKKSSRYKSIALVKMEYELKFNFGVILYFSYLS